MLWPRAPWVGPSLGACVTADTTQTVSHCNSNATVRSLGSAGKARPFGSPGQPHRLARNRPAHHTARVRISHYEVRDELARGGMGVVYRATDVRSGAQVVVKLLKVDTPRARRRLAREVTAMRALTHPRVVALHDAGEHEGLPYLVLPYVQGESLQDLLQRVGVLPVDDAVEVAIQVGQALGAAHALGLIHRDVKPDNVLVDERAHRAVKLTDFGLVKDTGSERSVGVSLSVRGRFLGTPGYWPPEQAHGRLHEIGPHSDVYALGGLLYAMLSGRPPRSAANLIQALSAFKHPVEPLGAQAPPWLDGLALRCLDTDPRARPPLRQVLAALEARRELDELDDAASPPPVPAGVPADATPSLRTFAAGLATGVAATVVAGIAWWAWSPGAAIQPALSEPSQPVATEEPIRPPLEPATPEPSGAEQAKAWRDAGDAKRKLGRWAEAIEDYDRALQLDPRDARAYADRGLAKSELGRWAEAIQDLDRALQLDPRDAYACTNRGVSKARMGRYAEAIEDYDRALELDPRHVLAYVNRGTSKAELGRRAEAIEDFDLALQLDPRHALAYASRGLTKASLGQHSAALQDLDRALEHAPAAQIAYTVHDNRGLLLVELGRVEEAAEAFGGAIEVDPRQALAYLHRGYLNANRGRFAEAIEDYDRGIQASPLEGLAYVNRGATKAKLGRYAEAIADYDRALELGVGPAARQVRQWRAEAAAKLAKEE